MSDESSRCTMNLDPPPVISPTRPNVPDLLELLATLANWKWEKAFAMELPGVTTSAIKRIESFPASQQKEEFFKYWLKSYHNASWRHILIALNKTQNDKLFCKVLENLITRSKLNGIIGTYSVASNTSDFSHRDARDTTRVATLRSLFAELVTSVKKKLIDQMQPVKDLLEPGNSETSSETETGHRVDLSEVVLSIEDYISITLPAHCTTNIDDFFTELEVFNNYVNCGLMECLINNVQFGLGDLKHQITNYSQQLHQFFVSSQLEHVASAMKDPVWEQTSSSDEFISQVTLRLIRNKWKGLSLAKLFQVIEYCFGSSVILYFKHITLHNEAIGVKFSIPHSHVESITPHINSKIHQLGIISVDIDGEVIVSTKLKKSFAENSCFKAASVGDFMSLLALLEIGVSVDCTDTQKQTPLMIATNHGQILVVQTLLSVGADPNKTNIEGHTALMIASANNIPLIVDILLQSNADSSIKTKEGHTALSLAKQNGHFSLVQNWLERPTGSLQAQEEVLDQSSLIELLPLFEILMKEQQPFNSVLTSIKEESISIDRKLALFMKRAREDPCLLTELKQQRTQDQSSFSHGHEYYTIKENFGFLVDLLSANGKVIAPLSNHLLSFDIIPHAIHSSVQNLHNSPSERATELFSSLLTTTKTHSTPNKVFSGFIKSLKRVQFTKISDKLVASFREKGGVFENGEEELHSTEMNETGATQQVPLELESQDVVAKEIKRLHGEFSRLKKKMKDHFEKLVANGLKLDTIASSATEFLGKHVDINNINKLFTYLTEHCDFFNYEVLEHMLEDEDLFSKEDTLYKKFFEYIESVKGFKNSTQLKILREAIKEYLPSQAETPPEDKDNARVVIKLEERWGDITLEKFEKVLKHYFGPKTIKTLNHLSFDFGSLCVAFLVPKGSHSQSLIDAVTSQKRVMSLVGVFDVAINEEKVLDKDENIDFDDSLRQSASFGDNFEALLLLQLQANPNSKGEDGKTALMLAAEHGHTELAGALLDSGQVDVTVKDNDGRTVKDIAILNNNNTLKERIEQEIASMKRNFPKGSNDVTDKKHSPLNTPNGTSQGPNPLNTPNDTSQGPNPLNTPNDTSQGPYPLDSPNNTNQGPNAETQTVTFPDIFVKGHDSLLKTLIERGVDISSYCDGSTPLILAIENCQIKVVQMLLDAKVDVNLQDTEGKTALIVATQCGQYQVIQLLIQQEQINYSILDNDGYACLHYACQNGSTEIASLLLDCEGAYCCTTSGSTPLMIASQHGQLSIIQLIHSSGYVTSIGEVLNSMTVSQSNEVMELLNTFIVVSIRTSSD